MARLTLPMFTPLPEVVSAPLFRVLQNHGSLNRSFCEVTKGTDDSLWLVTTYILSLPPSSVQFHIWKVQQNQECFCRRFFFFLSGEVFFFFSPPIKLLMQGCIVMIKRAEKLYNTGPSDSCHVRCFICNKS